VVAAMLTSGNRADISVAQDLLSDVAGCHILENCGYDSGSHRAFLRSQNNAPVIPGRKNRKIKIMYDEALYKQRPTIERYFRRLKENKRIDTRSDKNDRSFLAFIGLAAVGIFFN